jgi:NADH-quinone oxidoreductase subunit L
MALQLANYFWLIPLIPAVGFLLNGLLGKRWSEQAVAGIGCGAIIASCILSCYVFYCQMTGLIPDSITATLFDWIQVGEISVTVAFTFDHLSGFMAVMVSFVSALIHIYSIGYMEGDKSYYRFFSYLNLFCFMMLTLVLADNVLVMFVGWEGVGLCSYLLIGFWYEDHFNADAGKKAFIVNRIGDFAFLVGIFTLFWSLAKVGEPSLRFYDIDKMAMLLDGKTMGEILGIGHFLFLADVEVITFICIAFFIGATGKSAQIPLYVWLPDAMAGPTPVSALIHAATMVTAGVYMIGRMSALFVLSPTALWLIAFVGGLTALVSASIGLVQNDIKKVLAYSTVSQLGYMFIAMGSMAFSAGLFHLLTHAFFKACLFLGSGSVILACHHEQDMRRMGGLGKYLPGTYITFAAASLALAGFPLTAGFMSKDEILTSAFFNGMHHAEHAHSTIGAIAWMLPWVFGIIGAAFTAFYITRAVGMTFWGEYRGDEHTKEHLHEKSVMVYPLIVLAVLAIFGGLLNVPALFGGHDLFSHYVNANIAPVPVHEHDHFIAWILVVVSSLIAVGGIGLGWFIYAKRPGIAELAMWKFKRAHKVLLNKYYVDEFYAATVVRGTLLITAICGWFDKHIIDGIVNLSGKTLVLLANVTGWADWEGLDRYLIRGTGQVTLLTGFITRQIQTGRLTTYLYIVAAGVLVMLLATTI